MSKFVSKNSNLMIVLKSGIPGSTITGSQPQPGIYARFRDGQLVTQDENIIKLLKAHPGFTNKDFIEVFANEADPYLDQREEIEPGHVIQEMKYGHLEGVQGSKKKVKISKETSQFLNEEATRRMVKMLPTILKDNPEILKAAIDAVSKSEAKAEKPQKEDESPKA